MDLVLSPIFVGTGLNIKMLEAMANGLPILTSEFAGEKMGSTKGGPFHRVLNALIDALFIIEKESLELLKLAKTCQQYYARFYMKNLNNFKMVFKLTRKTCKKDYE